MHNHLLNRRGFLDQSRFGLAAVALASILDSEELLADGSVSFDPTAPYEKRPPHFASSAKNVIVIFCAGAVSHVDFWEYKPELIKYDGKPLPGNERLISFQGENGALQKPLWEFNRYGNSGKMLSSLVPHIGSCADDICFIHSMHTNIPEHAGAMMMFNLGHLQPSRPSLGSWLCYGLGTENQELPGLVAMSPRAKPRGKSAHWGNAFLPGAYSGVYANIASMKPDAILGDLNNPHLSRAEQRQQADLLAQLNHLDLARQEQDQKLESSIQAMEMAFRMQFAVPEAFDVTRETQNTLDMYGPTQYAKGCLLARRLVERGVRMVQLSLTIDGYDIAWDTGHGDIVGGHKRLADACDQGIAALLEDLKQRGMLEDTLVMWGGEFGRAPTSEGQKGRDHDHYGFTVWMAGGGVKPGFSYGATDEFGLTAVENRVHVHDLHATLLHIMGLDHEKLTYRYSGRDFRLTDVHGNVIHDILT